MSTGVLVSEMVDPVPAECRDCGCTDGAACYDDVSGITCHWIEPDLCSACFFEQNYSGPEPDSVDDEPRVQLYSEGDANRAIAAMRAGGAR